jgi:hypothetical protein
VALPPVRASRTSALGSTWRRLIFRPTGVRERIADGGQGDKAASARLDGPALLQYEQVTERMDGISPT